MFVRRVSKIGHEIYPVFCSLVEFMMLDLHLRWFLGDEIDPIIVVLFQSQIVQGERLTLGARFCNHPLYAG